MDGPIFAHRIDEVLHARCMLGIPDKLIAIFGDNILDQLCQHPAVSGGVDVHLVSNDSNLNVG